MARRSKRTRHNGASGRGGNAAVHASIRAGENGGIGLDHHQTKDTANANTVTNTVGASQAGSDGVAGRTMTSGDKRDISISALRQRYQKALGQRRTWLAHWQECYEFALPQRNGAATQTNGSKRLDRVFDSTAPDAVEQLAASLMAEITPPAGGWFDLDPGGNVADEDRQVLTAQLGRAVRILQGHFDRSNFAVEMHQAFLDLVTAGTACLRLESDDFKSPSAFRFAAVPLRDLVFEERADGKMDAVFRKMDLTRSDIFANWPNATLPVAVKDGDDAQMGEKRYGVIEAVMPYADGRQGYRLCVFFADATGENRMSTGDEVLLRDHFDVSPYIAFRWMKAPGEVYGRSPVMKALPDIKTANKVVELVLKNASIAVTGIWQADDDGVLNPATIRLVPGTIIPKAVGSAGLKPLDAPGRFDVSDLVLSDLRDRIRRCLLADRLGQVDQPGMTATEVLERASENARLLGATYGRLQAELLYPLIRRALFILAKRGELPDIPIDGDVVVLRHAAPLAQLPKRVQAAQALDWLSRIAGLGPDAMNEVDVPAMVHWLADQFGVPDHLLRPVLPPEIQAFDGPISDMQEAP